MRKPVLDWRPDKPTGVYAYPADSYWLSVLPYSDEWRWIVARPRGTMDGWSPTLEAAQVAAEDALRKHLADLVPVMQKLGMLESGAEPQQLDNHYRVGAGRCACGFDAYKVGGIMADYHQMLLDHLHQHRHQQKYRENT